MEPKTIPPTLRPKKRYIVYEIISEQKIEYNDITEAVMESALALFGDTGTAEMDLWHIKNLYSEEKQRGVIKCRHVCVEKTRLAIAAAKFAGETKAIFNIMGVTGTLKNAQAKYLQ